MVNSSFDSGGGGPAREAKKASGEPPPRFIIAPDDVHEGIIRLRGAEGHHAKNVLRLGRGDPFVAVDGRGVEYEAAVEILAADGLLGRIVRTTRRTREPRARIALAQALVKPAEIAAVVGQATALGVNEFTLFESARTRRRELHGREMRHLDAVAAAAVKQSLRAVLPEISGPRGFTSLLSYGREFDVAFLCRPDTKAEPLAEIVGGSVPGPSRFLVVVGPEGGFTSEEEENAANAGFRTLDLGPRRLRSVLAGPTACTLILYATGDLGPIPSPGE
jgi:16S rRNA (uracil1498-N3)-methyltransferase